MKVYHIYDENGKWLSVTQDLAAVGRKLKGVRGTSKMGGGGKVYSYYEEEVADDYGPAPKAKPKTGCKEMV